MDVLYILGNGSLFGNAELLYSLRTLDRHGQNIDNLILAGECPEFIDKSKVIYIPCKDTSTPTNNHWFKVRLAFEQTSSDALMLMYDDIFLTWDLDCNRANWYYKGDLPNVPQTEGYKKASFLAYKWLKSNGHTTRDYEEHMPCVYEKEKFKALDSAFESNSKWGGMAVRSVYANANNVLSEYMPDVKIFGNTPKFELGSTFCFSTTADNFFVVARKWLKENYKNKSRWEK